MPLYTVGNWSIDQLTTDTITTSKSLTLVDLDYANDYTRIQNDPDTVRLANTTGDGLTPVEYLRYAKRPIKNVYQGFQSVPDARRAPIIEGVSTLHEVRYLLKATNSVSGEEILLPFRGWVCLDVPTIDFVKPEAIELLLKRVASCCLATGSVNGTLVTDVARGDLDPSN